MRQLFFSLMIAALLLVMVSCSGGGNAVSPMTEPEMILGTSSHEGQNQTQFLWGLWQFTIDTAAGSVDITQLRSADKILNVLGFMEPPVLSSMDLDWADLNIDGPNNHVDVGIILTHPIPDDVFTGFDVRGVCFGPVVENADGLTIIPSPEFFKGVPFGYQDGLLGVPDSIGNYEGLAGYKYFCEGLGENEVLSDFFSEPGNLADRGKFGAGESIQRNYSLDWNNVPQDILVFNYAIYANHNWPIGDAPWDVDDWDITIANSAEAFCCSVTETASSLYFASGSGGGDLSLQVEVWDWQGDITNVTIESVESGVIAETSYDVALGNMGTDYSYGFEFNTVSGTPTSTGDLDILITVTDPVTFGEAWFLDLLPLSNSKYDELLYNCWIYTTTVSECPIATPTGINPNNGKVDQVIDDAVITVDGNLIDGTSLAAVLVQGSNTIPGTDVQYVNTTTLTADFDLTGANPGKYQVKVTNGCGTEATSSGDLFAVNTSGWAVTWGGNWFDYSTGVAADGSGNVYVTGYFGQTVDFDPGTGVDEHTVIGGDDVYLCKFDSLGGFLWAKTWGGTSYDQGLAVAADGSGNVYVTGRFRETVDFDPGSGMDEHTSNGFYDAFLSKFDSSGTFLWAKTWGASGTEYGCGVAADGSGNVYVTGYFQNTVDFDPGSGVDEHTSNGGYDVSLSKFDSSGGFLWAKTWGASGTEYGFGVAADGSGNVYVTGYFQQTVDFDPSTAGVDNHSSNGSSDVFLSKFDSSGTFQWAKTWGLGSADYGYAVAADESGNAYVTGRFQQTVDFDPSTAGIDEHTSNGGYDVFLSKFDSSGSFQWAKTWGGSSVDYGLAVAADGSGNMYVTGYFNGMVNFDTGSGVDTHFSNGSGDVYLSKFDSSGSFQWAKTWGGSKADQGFGVASDGSGNVYVTGFFSAILMGGTVDFDPGPGVDEHASNGQYDMFLSKFLSDGSW